jgi:transcriptional regulator with XRE-family HTH domain
MVSGDIILEARRRAGLTQADLAARLGIPRSQIGRWERYEVLPSFERLREIVRACGLELTYGLANADLEEHDLTLIRRSLSRPPSERFAQSAADAAAIYGLWSRARPLDA